MVGPKAHIDVGIWGGAIPGNLGESHVLHEAGVFGFTCFLSPSGVAEFPQLDRADLAAVLGELALFGGLRIAHAGVAHHLASAPPPAARATPTSLPHGRERPRKRPSPR